MSCTFKATPKAAAKDIHGSSQQMRDWQIDYVGPFPKSEVSKYVLVCVDTVPGLTQAFSGLWANQVATIRGLEKLSTIYRYPC